MQQATKAVSFREFSTRWQDDVLPLCKPATVATRRSHLRLINEALGNCPVDKLCPQKVQAFITGQARTKSSKTVQNLYLTLSAVVSYAQRQGIPMTVCKPTLPRRTKVEQEWLTGPQMAALVANSSGPRQIFYALLAETGLRIGEALALQARCVNLEDRVLGMPEAIIAQRVGHASEGMTLGVYVQKMDGADREWVEKIAEHFLSTTK